MVFLFIHGIGAWRCIRCTAWGWIGKRKNIRTLMSTTEPQRMGIFGVKILVLALEFEVSVHIIGDGYNAQ